MGHKINIYNDSLSSWENILKHENLENIQGGITDEHYHLTAAQEGYIDQDVTSSSAPSFLNENMSGNISVFTNDSGYISDGDFSLNVFNQTTPSSAWSIQHDLNSKYVLVQVFNTADKLIQPEVIELVDDDNLSITFDENVAGYCLYSKIAGTGGSSTPSDHGSLTGLGGDDHTIYSLVDGSRAFTSTISGITPTIDSHLSTKSYVDNKNWNATDISDFTTAVNNNTNVSNNTAHRTSNGSSHTYIDQNVTIGSSPQFSNTNMYGGISVWTNDENFIKASDVTFENLNSNGDVGTSATQVSKGDHNHEVLFYSYSTSGDIDISSGWTDLTFENESIKDAGYTFTNDKELAVDDSGLYEINYSASTYITSYTDDSEVLIKIQVDTGSGYTDINGSFSGLLNYSNTYGLNSANKTILLSLDDDDKIKILAKRNGGSSTIKTYPNSCTFLVKKLR